MKKNCLFAAILLIIITALSSCASNEDDIAQANITPEKVFDIYQDFSELPRSGSNYPSSINQYITNYLQSIGIKAKEDKSGNLTAYIPATEKFKSEKPLIVLCDTFGKIVVSPDTILNTETEGAVPKISDSKTISADGTSMAAESAIGIADALAAASSIMSNEKTGGDHRAVRLIFAADIKSISSKWLKGSLLVSLGEAGTSRVALSSEYAEVLESDTAMTPIKTTTKYAYVISVSGYPGGAFGLEKAHPNPLNALIEILTAVNNSGIHYNLCSITGGNDALTAPTEATAIIAMNDYEQKKFTQVFNDVSKSLNDSVGEVAITQTLVPEYSVSDDNTGRVITHLFSLSDSDFTEENKNLSGVFIGNVSLTPNRFACKASVIGHDSNTIRLVSVEAESIQVLSDIPIKKISDIAGFTTQNDDAAVTAFIKEYARSSGNEIRTTRLGISSLGLIPAKSPKLPVISVGVSVKNKDMPTEQMNLKDISAPANAILDFAYFYDKL